MTRLFAAAPRRAGVSSTVAASLAGKSAEAVTLLALVSLVPRAFGAADYGVFALALAVVTIGSATAALGGPVLLTRFVAGARPGEREELARALALRLGRVRAGQAVVFAAVAIGLAVARPETFEPVPTLLVGLALVLDIFATLAYQVALSLGATTLWSFRFPLQNAVLVGAALALYDVGGATGAIAALPLSSGAALLVGGSTLLGRLGPASRAVDVPRTATRFGLYAALSGFLVQLGHRGPVLAVAVLGGSTAEAGVAALATGIALAGTYVVWQAFVVELPRLSARAAADAAGAEASAGNLARKALVAVIPLAVAAALLLPPLLPKVVGAGFSNADAALAPALAALTFAPLTALVTQVSALRVRGEARAAAFGVGALAFALTAVVAVPRWEAVGATAAFLAGTAATALAAPVVLRGVYGPRPLAAAVGAAAAVLLLGAVA